MGTASCIAQLRNPKLSKNTEDLASRVSIQPISGHKIQGCLDLVLCSKDTEILIQIVEATQLPAGTHKPILDNDAQIPQHFPFFIQ